MNGVKRQKQILDDNDHDGAGQPASRILRTTTRHRRRPGADRPTPSPSKPLPPTTVPMVTIIDSSSFAPGSMSRSRERAHVDVAVDLGRSRYHVPGEAGIWIFIFGDITLYALLSACFMLDRRKNPSLFDQAGEHPAHDVRGGQCVSAANEFAVGGTRRASSARAHRGPRSSFIRRGLQEFRYLLEERTRSQLDHRGGECVAVAKVPVDGWTRHTPASLAMSSIVVFVTPKRSKAFSAAWRICKRASLTSPLRMFPVLPLATTLRASYRSDVERFTFIAQNTVS
jgi:hypothetical protein